VRVCVCVCVRACLLANVQMLAELLSSSAF
jgi:hypothetical protein